MLTVCLVRKRYENTKKVKTLVFKSRFISVVYKTTATWNFEETTYETLLLTKPSISKERKRN